MWLVTLKKPSERIYGRNADPRNLEVEDIGSEPEGIKKFLKNKWKQLSLF